MEKKRRSQHMCASRGCSMGIVGCSPQRNRSDICSLASYLDPSNVGVTLLLYDGEIHWQRGVELRVVVINICHHDVHRCRGGLNTNTHMRTFLVTEVITSQNPELNVKCVFLRVAHQNDSSITLKYVAKLQNTACLRSFKTHTFLFATFCGSSCEAGRIYELNDGSSVTQEENALSYQHCCVNLL